jgi:hypothetical protein
MVGGHYGWWGQETAGQLREEGARGLISNYRDLKMERRAREGGWVRSVSRSAPLQQKKRRGAREEEEGDADRWGRCVSDIEEKKEAGETGLLREGERWAGGPAGLKGVRSSFFFSFLFQTLLKFKPFQLKFHSKFLKLFQKIL